MAKSVSIIGAVAKNGAIGYRNQLLYRLPEDLKFFKSMTTGCVVVMGGNTYKSLPNGPLPGRLNVVISTSIENEEGYDNLLIFNNSDELLNFIENTNERIFIIGGAAVYNMFIDKVDELFITELDASPIGDSYFPFFDKNDYDMTVIGNFEKDDKHEVDFKFVHYKKKDKTKKRIVEFKTCPVFETVQTERGFGIKLNLEYLLDYVLESLRYNSSVTINKFKKDCSKLIQIKDETFEYIESELTTFCKKYGNLTLKK